MSLGLRSTHFKTAAITLAENAYNLTDVEVKVGVVAETHP